MISGYNDSEENLRRTAEFVSTLETVEEVSLLPCNTATGAKYQFIGQNYKLEYVISPPKEKTMAFVDIFSRLSIKAELGR